ncbi:hypothetical protein HDE_06718 [Halotydeus destructor]|nr:hypothetical protein HDE_06718 [Halotydeus destructor]
MTRVSLDQLELDLNQIKSVMYSLNDKLYIIPLSWFSFTFASSLAQFVDFQTAAIYHNRTVLILTAYEMSFKLLGVIITAMMTRFINEYLSFLYLTQYMKIVSTEGMSKRADFVRSREQEYLINPSAANIFDVSRKGILQYLSALITFTILFMQLNKVL